MLVAMVVKMVVIETVLLVVMMMAMVLGTLTKFLFHQDPATDLSSGSFHSSPSHHKHSFPYFLSMPLRKYPHNRHPSPATEHSSNASVRHTNFKQLRHETLT
jgi:hypothetical protein